MRTEQRRTQNTVVYSVKARVFNGLRGVGTVYYPIWWGIAAWPVDNFVKEKDFSGKTAIPFATSSSSGMGESGTRLEEMAGTGDWQEGRRFSSGASEEKVRDWVAELDLNS